MKARHLQMEKKKEINFFQTQMPQESINYYSERIRQLLSWN